eukprot:Pompholyxophrys_punicea_v1_NODE_376_length_2093_cov_35.121153.p1 type:complete len:254 gc:universal NODE_376_length_2093_cov_35.121153:1744-983(-)
MLQLVNSCADLDESVKSGFKAKTGWLIRFCKRNCLSVGKPSNKKSMSSEERAPYLKRYFARTEVRLKRGFLPEATGIQTVDSPVHGKFPFANRLNTDQVGLNFDNANAITYDTTGKEQIWLPGTKNAGEHRWCTINVTARPVNSPLKQPRLTIVFKGKGMRISQHERAAWHTGVNVEFQKKAWMDDELCAKWATVEAPKIVQDLYGNAPPPLFWTFDNLSGQANQNVLRDSANAMAHMLEPGCTDSIQLIINP